MTLKEIKELSDRLQSVDNNIVCSIETAFFHHTKTKKTVTQRGKGWIGWKGQNPAEDIQEDQILSFLTQE